MSADNRLPNLARMTVPNIDDKFLGGALGPRTVAGLTRNVKNTALSHVRIFQDGCHALAKTIILAWAQLQEAAPRPLAFPKTIPRHNYLTFASFLDNTFLKQ